jgi:CheY-like chemotaxis protein
LLDALKTRAGYDVQVARSSFEVGAAIEKQMPHAVLINFLTNGVDAHGICKCIRSNEEYSTIKIIALANQLSSQESAALLQRGFDGHVSNPADAGEVIRKIEEATAIIY